MIIDKKTCIFWLVLIPWAMHIICITYPILMGSNILISTAVLLISIGFLGYRFPCSTDFWWFLPFLIVLFLQAFLFVHENFKDIIKYVGYILVYIFALRPYFAHEKYYRWFVNLVVVSFIIMFLLYILALFVDYYSWFSVNSHSLKFLPINSPIYARKDFDYYIPFYFLVFAKGDPELSLLGIPRFFGYSTEPTIYCVTVLPTIFLALCLRMYRQAIVLLFALIATSSYGALAFFLLSSMFYVFYRYRVMMLTIMGLGCLLALVYLGSDVIALFFSKYIHSDSNRLSSYSQSVVKTIHYGYQWITTKALPKDVKLGLALTPANVMAHYGVLALLSFVLIIYLPFHKAYKIDSRILFCYVVSFSLMIMKLGEPFPPIFLFYLNFLNINSLKLGVLQSKR